MSASPFPTTSGLKSASIARTYRLTRLAALLESGQTWTSDKLAEQLQVCKRTLFRDVSLLRKTNFPILFDSVHGGYRVPNGRSGGSSALKADELVALGLAVKYLEPLPEDIAIPCARAISKILSAASANISQATLPSLEQDQPGNAVSSDQS